ncbi:MAG: hypothetical protein JRG70_07945 [Deltaproteobacteria bacterium]|nr:hypothetical protein [Deltaproteobacteria bacterium]
MRVMKLPVFRGALVCFLVPLFSLFSLLGCTTDSDPGDEQDKSLRMNEIQVLGTHNSYHIQPRDSILEGLATFDSQELADSLEYTAYSPIRTEGCTPFAGVSSWSMKTPSPAFRNWMSQA